MNRRSRIALSATIVTADGKTIPIKFTATLDGKDSPFQSPDVDAPATMPIDALTADFTTKLAADIRSGSSGT